MRRAAREAGERARRAEVERLRIDDVTWTARRGLAEELGRLGSGGPDPDGCAGSARVKATPGRAVWRLPFGGGAAYLKRYRVRSWRERAKYWLLASRAEQEWRAAHTLAAAGIEAAEPLAVGVSRRGPRGHEVWFLAREAPGVPYPELLAELRRKGEIEPLLRETAALVARLFAAGLVHPDLHGGNLLARLEPTGPRLALVDLHAIRLRRRIGARARRRVLSKLAHSLWRMLEEEELARALALLAPGAEHELRRAIGELERTRLRSRSRRCVTESTAFARERRHGWTVWRRREVPLEALLALAREAPRDGVVQLAVAGAPRGARVQRRRGRGWLRAWKGAHALRVREIPAPLAWAYLERRRAGWPREALLVTEALPGALPLEGLPGALRSEALARAALDTAARLHRAGLGARPRDLLALPAEGDPDAARGWRVLCADLEVRPRDRALSPERAAREREALRRITG